MAVLTKRLFATVNAVVCERHAPDDLLMHVATSPRVPVYDCGEVIWEEITEHERGMFREATGFELDCDECARG